MEHARIHVDPEVPSHDAEGLHVEMTDTRIRGLSSGTDEWHMTHMEQDDARKRPSNEKLLVRIVRV